METSGLAYHEATRYDRSRMSGHFLDWEHQPSIYKSYPGIRPLELPCGEACFPDVRLSRLLKDPDAIPSVRHVDLRLLSCIFRLTYSLTAKARHAGGDSCYRSVASAGALYPAEVYVAASGIAGLKDGLYHFSVARHGLSLLRPGRFPSSGKAKDDLLDRGHPLLTFFVTVIFFRSAWKYRERSYRYHLLDAGHLAENLILALKAVGLSGVLELDFDDGAVNRLLGVDVEREACLALCRTSQTPAFTAQAVQETAEVDDAVLGASRVSGREISYPAIQAIHRAGVPAASARSLEGPMVSLVGPVPKEWRPLTGIDTRPETVGYAQAVLGRRSRRNFVTRPLRHGCMAGLLDGLCRRGGEVPERGAEAGESAIAVGFLVGHAEGWKPGFYLLDRESRACGLVEAGWLIDRMARICLDQMWAGRAQLHVVFLSNLQAVDRVWGPRGYRYAMMTAGRLGERLYLTATAMGIGCCGIGAFYDEEAALLLRLNPQSRLLYLAAIGPTQ